MQTMTTVVPLGTTPTGGAATWHLTRDDGAPVHGLITGLTGSGGTTALARIGAGARQAGMRVVHVTLDGEVDGPVRDVAHTSEYTEVGLARQLDHAAQATYDPAVGHIVLLVDGARALTACPHGWEGLLRNADLVGVSVVARVHALDHRHLGGDTVREGLLHHGQYLALGRLTGTATRLATAVLPGYAPRTDTPRPGDGVYGLCGTSTPVTVTR